MHMETGLATKEGDESVERQVAWEWGVVGVQIKAVTGSNRQQM